MNLIVGTGGTGKTTLAQQMMFAMATPERPAIFFSVLGEPILKVLRYQQGFSFFDREKLGSAVHLVNLNRAVADGSFEETLARIQEEIERHSPSLVFVDSFRAVLLESRFQFESALTPQLFLEQLGLLTACWQVTTFLVGDLEPGNDAAPVFTMVDGVLVLTQRAFANTMVRQLRVAKMRGCNSSPGLHTLRISRDGLTIYPSVMERDLGKDEAEPRSSVPERVSMGVPELDEMLGGGLPKGHSMLVAGPSGSGKSLLTTAFLEEGRRRGETGVFVAFEQAPARRRVRGLESLVRSGMVQVINVRAMDLSLDEVFFRLASRIRGGKVSRVVIDSLSGFELAVAPAFRGEYRESLYRIVTELSRLGATSLLTTEQEDRFVDLRFSPYGSAFLTDAILVQRYVELEGRLRRVLAVVKVRGSAHSNQVREYEITDSGIQVLGAIEHVEGLFSGHANRARSTDVPRRDALQG